MTKQTLTKSTQKNECILSLKISLGFHIINAIFEKLDKNKILVRKSWRCLWCRADFARTFSSRQSPGYWTGGQWQSHWSFFPKLRIQNGKTSELYSLCIKYSRSSSFPTAKNLVSTDSLSVAFNSRISHYPTAILNPSLFFDLTPKLTFLLITFIL